MATRAADRGRARRDQAEIERLRAELSRRDPPSGGDKAASQQPREGRAIRWGTIITALATVAAVVVAGLAYVASKDAVRISQQQRTDVQVAFLGRVMIQPKRFADSILKGGQLVIINANTLATEARLSVEAKDDTHSVELLVKATIPGCSQVTYEIPDEVEAWDGIEGAWKGSRASSEGASVYNPLDDRWWSVGFEPEFPSAPLTEDTQEALLDGLWQEMPQARFAKQTVKGLSGCV